VAVVERAVPEVGALEAVEDGRAGDSRRHREVPARHRLAEAKQVRLHVALLRREERAGASEAGRDLVADQQHVRLPAGLPEPAEPARRAHPHACGRLDQRLDDDGGELGGVLVHHGGGGLEAPGVVERGGPEHREAQRREEVRAEAPVPDRHGADGVAVIGAAECEEAGAARLAAVGPVLKGHLDRLLERAGAVGGEHHVRARDRRHARQLLGQLHDDPAAVAQHRAVRDPSQLLQQGRVELGDTVAEGVDPERRDGVEVGVALDVDQVAALGRLHDDRRVLGEGRHLGEPMPDDRAVALDPALVSPLPGRGAHRPHMRGVVSRTISRLPDRRE
jgi:hypothetical protein